MKLAIVPNEVRDMINERLDAAILANPGSEQAREILYHQLLGFFDDYGYLPEFHLEKIENG